MSFAHTQSQQLRTAILIQGVLYCFIPAIAKILSLSENLDVPLASGPIEVRQFFKIQT